MTAAGKEKHRAWPDRRHRAARAAALAALVLLGPASTAAAAEIATEWQEQAKSRIRLSAARLETDGAKGLHAFVEIEMPKGWKTYWKAPGESGVPPHFDWSRSENLASATVLYPAPKRIVDKEGGEVVGYHDRVTFPVAIVPTEAGKPIGLDLTLQYGICKDICIPGEAQLSLTVPADAAGEPNAEGLAALEDVPRTGTAVHPDDPVLKSAVAHLRDARPRIVIAATFPGGAAGADVFLDAPGGAYLPPPRKSAEAGSDLTFEVDLSSDVDLDALKGAEIGVTLSSPRGKSASSFKLE